MWNGGKKEMQRRLSASQAKRAIGEIDKQIKNHVEWYLQAKEYAMPNSCVIQLEAIEMLETKRRELMKRGELE